MEAVCWIIKIIVHFVCKKLSTPIQCHVCVALFHVTTICSTTLSLSHWNYNYRNVWINNCSERIKALFQFVVINPFARIVFFCFHSAIAEFLFYFRAFTPIIQLNVIGFYIDVNFCKWLIYHRMLRLFEMILN